MSAFSLPPLDWMAVMSRAMSCDPTVDVFFPNAIVKSKLKGVTRLVQRENYGMTRSEWIYTIEQTPSTEEASNVGWKINKTGDTFISAYKDGEILVGVRFAKEISRPVLITTHVELCTQIPLNEVVIGTTALKERKGRKVEEDDSESESKIFKRRKRGDVKLAEMSVGELLKLLDDRYK